MTRPTLTEMHDKLMSGMEAWKTGEGWARMLKLSRSMHSYSWRNLALVEDQYSGATMVAGYRKWHDLGRQVRGGEKAIWILAPVKYKKDKEAAEGEGAEKEIRGFKPVPVFALEQTDGEELPIPMPLHGERGEEVWAALIKACDKRGYFVVMTDLGARDGATAPIQGKVFINKEREPFHQLVSLVHEYSHVTLGHVADMGEYVAQHQRSGGRVDYVACVRGTWSGLVNQQLRLYRKLEPGEPRHHQGCR